MYHAASRLPHLLRPEAYVSPDGFEREMKTAFAGAWSLACSTADVAASGDQVATTIRARPVVVRNFHGELKALSNVCAHRHCLIRPLGRSRSDTLRCQYHGWEYRADGHVDHIPEAHNFTPHDAPRPVLKSFRVETCGALVFVALEADAPPLAEALGAHHGLIAERFGAGWRQTLAYAADVAADWKVGVENGLESYHVPQVHAATFRADPGESRSVHVLADGWTDFVTTLPFAAASRADRAYQDAEARLLRLIGAVPTGSYRHLHIFPNLLLSFTDTVSLAQAFEPVGPGRSRAVARLFAPRPAAPWKRALLGGWSRGKAAVVRRILDEDLALYGDIQAGLAASDQAGMLGRCEERIHAFQSWLLAQAEGGRESR